MAKASVQTVAEMLELFAARAPRPDPAREFLFARAWVPLGKNCVTGIEGWGKVIDGKSVAVDMPEALKIAGWPG